jgi:hypothetical protein
LTEFSVSLDLLMKFSISLAEADGKLRQPRVVGRVMQEIDMAFLSV